MELICCTKTSDFETALVITRDYLIWLQMDLSFQNTEKEFNEFEIMYGHPHGVYLYFTDNNKVAGGVGCRFLEPNICEMKRLFIYDHSQGQGLGRILCSKLFEYAKSLGYSKMRLDTIARLKSANRLYEKMGFYDIHSYRENPDSTARFMEKLL